MAAPIVPTPHTMFFHKSDDEKEKHQAYPKSDEEKKTEELLLETDKRKTEIENAMLVRHQRLQEYEQYKEKVKAEKAEWQKHAAAGTIADAQSSVEKMSKLVEQVEGKIAEHKDRLMRDQDKLKQLDERRKQIEGLQQRQQEKHTKQQQKLLQKLHNEGSQQATLSSVSSMADRPLLMESGGQSLIHVVEQKQSELDNVKVQQKNWSKHCQEQHPPAVGQPQQKLCNKVLAT